MNCIYMMFIAIGQMERKWEFHLCETLELVNKNLCLNIYCIYFEKFAYNATLYSNIRNIIYCFETCKDIITRHNGAGMTMGLVIATYSHRHSAPIACIRRQV